MQQVVLGSPINFFLDPRQRRLQRVAEAPAREKGVGKGHGLTVGGVPAGNHSQDGAHDLAGERSDIHERLDWLLAWAVLAIHAT